MTNPLGAADFFALEAGECLDRLEHLVTDEAPPAGEEFLRLARVLRGSALMASQTQIARAAAGLEGLARAQRDHRRAWDAATREQVAQSVEEFRLLVRRAREWTESDTVRAVQLSQALETLTGVAPRDVTPAIPAAGSARQELPTGVRAFVAREGAAAVSEAELAAFLAPKVPRYKMPKRFFFWEALPKSGYGKIPKRLVRDELEARGLLELISKTGS